MSARMAGPRSKPPSEARPEGRSRATTGMATRPHTSLTSSMAWAISPCAAPVSPVPRSASTTRSAPARALRTEAKLSSPLISSTRPRQRRSACAASPVTSARLPRSSTRGRAPLLLRCRATTKPSPPLLPLPHRMVTRLPRMGAHSRTITAAAPRPAFSMSCGPGMPSFSMARASRARISAAVKTGCTLPPFRGGEQIGGLREEVGEHGRVDLAVGGARDPRQLDVHGLLRAREKAARLGLGGRVAEGVHRPHEDVQARGIGLGSQVRVAHELEQGLEPPGLIRADPHGGDLHAAGALLVRVAVDFDVVAEGALRGLGHRPVVRLVDPTRLGALLLAGGR